MGAISKRLDVSIVHGRDELGELAADVVGVAAPFGDIATQPALETDLLGDVDEDRVVEQVVDPREAEEQDALDHDDVAGVHPDRRARPRVGREVVFGDVDPSPPARNSARCSAKSSLSSESGWS